MYHQWSVAKRVWNFELRNAVFFERRSFQGHLTQKLHIKPIDRKCLFDFLNGCVYGFVLHKNLNAFTLSLTTSQDCRTGNSNKPKKWHSVGSLTVVMHMWHVMYVSMNCNWSWSPTLHWIFVADLLTFHHWPCKFRKFLIDLTVGVVKMITSDIKGPYKIDYQCSTEKHFQILVYLYILSLIRTFTIPKSISKNSTFFLI